jgi:UDP-2,3-diacylglucosamine hydrolase
MYHNTDIVIKEGAFFITDAHYNKNKNPHFLSFLKQIKEKKLNPTQLFLLGDIFDALFGNVAYTAKDNQEVIDLIEEISKEIEVIYLEGNHDFYLKYFFSSKIKIYPIKTHPIKVKANKKTICLAHGDFDSPLGYKLYTALIRNPLILLFLNIYDKFTNHSILKFVDKHMSKKEECKKLSWFDDFIKQRVKKFKCCDIYIDGHFHQNKTYNFENIKYINLGAFACNQRYFVVKLSQNEFILAQEYLK